MPLIKKYYSKAMKKFITFAIAILYLVTSTGATVRLHYCMGNLASWGIGYDLSKRCAKCDMSATIDMTGCCNDEHTFIKNSSDQSIDYVSVSLSKPFIISNLPFFSEVSLSLIASTRNENFWETHFPISRNVKVYLFNRSFLI